MSTFINIKCVFRRKCENIQYTARRTITDAYHLSNVQYISSRSVCIERLL